MRWQLRKMPWVQTLLLNLPYTSPTKSYRTNVAHWSIFLASSLMFSTALSAILPKCFDDTVACHLVVVDRSPPHYNTAWQSNDRRSEARPFCCFTSLLFFQQTNLAHRTNQTSVPTDEIVSTTVKSATITMIVLLGQTNGIAQVCSFCFSPCVSWLLVNWQSKVEKESDKMLEQLRLGR